MRVNKTNLSGVLLIRPDVFEDHRGEFVETYNESLYEENGIDVHFVQDDISVSTHNVLRGIHGDQSTWKLISCLHGRLYCVVVDCDKSSPGFRKWQAFTLSDRNRQQILVPPRHGNGYYVLSEMAIFSYKQSAYYDPAGQFTYKWNDPDLNIWWPSKTPILSVRDDLGHYA